VAVVTALVLGGCASSGPEHDYELEALPAPAVVLAESMRVAVDPVSLPPLVDRAGMVFLDSQGEVFVSEEWRWAEPLRVEVGRVVAQDLVVRLGGARVSAYPQEPLEEPEIKVRLAIGQWQVRPGQEFRASVDWSVLVMQSDAAAAPRLREGHMVIATPLAGRGIGVMLDAQDRALAQLSDALAGAILSLRGPT
jgi:uncharacterized lipoprotein YmbA